MKSSNYDSAKVAMRLRDLRTVRGYTREEVAAQLSIDASYLRHLENGTRGGSVEVFDCISDLYNVSLDYLIKGKIRDENTEAGDFVANEDLRNALKEIVDEMKKSVDLLEYIIRIL